ncbi:isocitrate lyase/PEP mutase family protein [Roseomonas harenae]|uniref:isocitrate lyase/PEP mutase family protein n=1 Tax=Muricoccus harenae TaxID=2692566 RepID=UPI0013317076|nr:isocitrate lyase/PEP mutase family protein [Roseomonas harenae]
MPNQAANLRAMLAGDELIVAPGAYDGLTATLVAKAGFKAIYMSGAATAASFGLPDFGLVTMTEMVATAGRIARTADLPVIADADTGFGDEMHVFRAVREYEAQGVAAIHMEDQEFPKRCGHLEGKAIIPLDEYLAKIRAAAAARRSPDFTIIARTDSRAVAGFEEAIRRANAALEAGADVAFVEAPESAEEIAEVPRRVKGPCLLNFHRGGKTPNVDLPWIQSLGYKIAIVPGLLLRSVANICEQMLAELQETGRHPVPVRDHSTRELFQKFGADEWDDRRERFRTPGPSRAAAE